MLEKSLVFVKDPNPMSVDRDNAEGNGGGVRLFKNSPIGIVFDHKGMFIPCNIVVPCAIAVSDTLKSGVWSCCERKSLFNFQMNFKDRERNPEFFLVKRLTKSQRRLVLVLVIFMHPGLLGK